MLRKSIPVVSWSIAGQAVALVLAPVITRILLPSDFALLGILTAIASVSAAVGGLKMYVAVPSVTTVSTAISASVIAVAGLVVASIFATLITYIVSKSSHQFEQIGDLGYFPIFVATMCIGIYHLSSSWVARFQHYRTLGIGRFMHGVSTSTAQLLLAALAWKLALIWGFLIGLLLASLVMLRGTFSELCAAIRREFDGKSSLRSSWPLLSRYAFYATPAGVVNVLCGYVPPLLLLKFFGLEVYGSFVLTQRVLAAPIGLVGQSLSQVFLGAGGQAVGEEAGKFRALVFRTMLILFLFGIIPVLVLFFFGEEMFGLIFGQNWAMAGRFAELMAFMLLAQFVIFPVSHTLNIIGAQRVQLGWDICRLAVCSSAVMCGAYWFSGQDSPDMAVMFLSIAHVIMYLLFIFICNKQMSKA